jgi:hypothetical protein
MQLFDPGSKHTLAPVPAADEAACCVKCMESTACYGAELYGAETVFFAMPFDNLLKLKHLLPRQARANKYWKIHLI